MCLVFLKSINDISDPIIYCLSSSIKAEIEKNNCNIKISPENFKETYHEEMRNFRDYLNEECYKVPFFFKIIRRCISAYMIKKSYILNNISRLKNYEDYYKSTNENIDSNDFKFITLKNLYSCNSKVDLIYSIETERLYVLKSKMSCNEEYLINREQENYKYIQHPLFLQCYKSIQKYDQKFLLLEFSDGKTVKQINELTLNDEEKFKIIFEILISMQYIHSKNFIYRDLKPSNIMIDKNNTAVIIDLDKMIRCTDENTQNYSKSFNDYFVAPEIVSNESNIISFKADIFSIGMIILFILSNGKIQIDSSEGWCKPSFENLPNKFNKMKKLIELCTSKNPNLRPNLYWIINYLYINYFLQINENLLNEIIVKDAECCQFNSSYYEILEVILFNQKCDINSTAHGYYCSCFISLGLYKNTLNGTIKAIEHHDVIDNELLKKMSVMIKKTEAVSKLSESLLNETRTNLQSIFHNIR